MSLETNGLVMGLPIGALTACLTGALLAVATALMGAAILAAIGLAATMGFLASGALSATLAVATGLVAGLAGAAFATGLGEALVALLGLVAVFLEFLFSGMSVGKFSLKAEGRVALYCFFLIQFSWLTVS